MRKELCVTSDFYDDVIRAGRHFRKEDLDAFMAYCAKLGATRHEWVLDTMWTLYDEDGPVGYDLLAEACAAAHRHGLRFDVVYKPFEGGLSNAVLLLPHDLPRPAGVRLLDEVGGLVHCVRPFVAAHPEMRSARRPEDADPGGRIAALRVITTDNTEAPLTRDDFQMLTSPRNGGFVSYAGPVTLRRSTEWHRLHPARDRACRVLTFEGLDLPPDTRYVMLRYTKDKPAVDLTNAVENLAELVNERGDVIPSTPAVRRVNVEAMYQRARQIDQLELTPYGRCAEIHDFVSDREHFIEHCRDMQVFNAGWEDVSLNNVDALVLARGKPAHVVGVLNPVYDEVREHWMNDVRFCIDRGVDGVNFRVADHNRPYEPWAYGFNPPTRAQMQDPDNFAEAARINGRAYTGFLRDAAETLHAAGKEIGVHAHGLIFHHDDRSPNNTPLPHNIQWEWDTWIRDIADYVEFRGAANLRPENIRQVTDRIGLACREAGIPFIYQSTRTPGVIHFDGPHPTLANEMDWVHTRPDIAIYNLYEIANFSRINGNDEWEGSPDIAELARTHWFV